MKRADLEYKEVTEIETREKKQKWLHCFMYFNLQMYCFDWMSQMSAQTSEYLGSFGFFSSSLI